MDNYRGFGQLRRLNAQADAVRNAAIRGQVDEYEALMDSRVVITTTDDDVKITATDDIELREPTPDEWALMRARTMRAARNKNGTAQPRTEASEFHKPVASIDWERWWRE